MLLVHPTERLALVGTGIAAYHGKCPKRTRRAAYSLFVTYV